MEQVFDADGVRGVLHTPEEATGDGLALTHGAGSNANAPLLVSLARTFWADLPAQGAPRRRRRAIGKAFCGR